MGRHARGAVRSRSTATAVGIAVPVLLLVATASWWALSGSAQPDSTVTGSAVVVSSLACRNGDEGTVVDLLNPAGAPPGTTRRATLDSCGRHAGEVLAVDYSSADPSRVVPAATRADDHGGTDRLLPLGLLLAALLAVAAIVAVIRDSRRARPAVPAPGNPESPATDRHGRHALPDEDEPLPADVTPVEQRRPRRPNLDLLLGESLAANLHDELFTHRSTASV